MTIDSSGEPAMAWAAASSTAPMPVSTAARGRGSDVLAIVTAARQNAAPKPPGRASVSSTPAAMHTTMLYCCRRGAPRRSVIAIHAAAPIAMPADRATPRPESPGRGSSRIMATITRSSMISERSRRYRAMRRSVTNSSTAPVCAIAFMLSSRR
ncbi:hypothetical protein ACQP2P_13455 [Dactylosporangium sp. CA-139114]|uniref:hypothetical protein n=1 Tax=Dactylosporangium sp. CA-139114 TaxID=3239931 RepID=UPI003D9841BB